VTDFNVLPLPYYDMIVGIDWLESRSPLQIYLCIASPLRII
jgi:hypothetical protein